MADVFGQIALERLLFPEYEYDIHYLSDAKSYRAHGTSLLRTNGRHDAPFDDEGGDRSENQTAATETLAVKKTDMVQKRVREFLHEQVKDPFCKQTAETALQPASQYDHDHYRFLICMSALDEMLQRIAPKQLKTTVLYLASYRHPPGHLGCSRMFYTLRQEQY